jgi:hypothetical protein
MTDLPIIKSRRLGKDEKLAETRQLTRAYVRWQREQLSAALAGAHGAMIAELLILLDQLEMSSAAMLLDFMQRSDWNAVDYNTRFAILHEINQAIERMRTRHGLPPIDDPLPPKQNVFLCIKHMLFPPSPAKAGSSPSEVATQSVPGCDVTTAASTKGVNDDE